MFSLILPSDDIMLVPAVHPFSLSICLSIIVNPIRFIIDYRPHPYKSLRQFLLRVLWEILGAEGRYLPRNNVTDDFVIYHEVSSGINNCGGGGHDPEVKLVSSEIELRHDFN